MAQSVMWKDDAHLSNKKQGYIRDEVKQKDADLVNRHSSVMDGVKLLGSQSNHLPCNEYIQLWASMKTKNHTRIMP
jgi:hypothetical protein